MATSERGTPAWLPIVGVVIAVLLFVGVVMLNSNPRGTVSVKAPAGTAPVSGPDEGSIRPGTR